MRQVSIATVLMAASILGMVAPAQAVKVTYSTLVTSDPASQGGRKFTIPVFSPKQPTVKVNKVAKRFLTPSIDRQRVIFGAKTDPVSFGTAGQKFDVNASGLFYEFSGDLKTVDSRMEINDDVNQPTPTITNNYDSPDIEGVNVAYSRRSFEFNNTSFIGTISVNLWRSTSPTKTQVLVGGCKYNFSTSNTPTPDPVTVGGDRVTILAGKTNGCPVMQSDKKIALVQGTVGSSNLTTLVDGKTKIPGTSKPFSLNFTEPVAKGSNVLFSNDGGLYLFKGGKLSTIVKPDQVLPGGDGKLGGLVRSDFDGNTVVFSGITTFNAIPGIYVKTGQTVTKVARTGEPIPGGNRNFYDLSGVKISGSTILFTESGKNGSSDRGTSLYVRYGGKITKLVSEGDRFKGKTIALISLGKRPLNGDTIVFALEFTDGNGSVVKAKLSP
jgi:hypothetical protein